MLCQTMLIESSVVLIVEVVVGNRFGFMGVRVFRLEMFPFVYQRGSYIHTYIYTYFCGFRFFPKKTTEQRGSIRELKTLLCFVFLQVCSRCYYLLFAYCLEKSMSE